MNIDRFTEKGQAAIIASQEIALRMGHQQIDGEHIHYALLIQDEGLIPKLIGYMGVDAASCTKDIEAELKRLPKVQGSAASNLYATRRFNEVLIQAE
ncbi:MAG: type VI secretion system ATPase TssH, partial [Clostridiales bacterium]|nr:type VI secretion system ATPase TssH [Clostridiales bacterium]